MQAKYRISEQDYVNANKLFGKLTSKHITFYIIATLLLGLTAIFGSSALKGGAIGGLIGGLIATLAGKYILAPFLAKRHYRKYKAIHDEFTIELLDDGVRFMSSTGEGKVEWDTIFKWRENDDYILIYPMPRLYHIVPKSISANDFDIQQLIDALKTNIGESK